MLQQVHATAVRIPVPVLSMRVAIMPKEAAGQREKETSSGFDG